MDKQKEEIRAKVKEKFKRSLELGMQTRTVYDHGMAETERYYEKDFVDEFLDFYFDEVYKLSSKDLPWNTDNSTKPGP